MRIPVALTAASSQRLRSAAVTEALHVDWSGSGERVLLVHGSFWAADRTFAAQRPLADEFRLGLVDRRGFGLSPDTERVDFDRDAEDLAALLHEDAHLVGHSYGGIGCMLAAARRPDRVRSLTVIEPPALALAAGHPAVDELIARSSAAYAVGEPTEAFARFVESWGFPRPSAASLARQDARALTASSAERSPAEAQVPLDALAATQIPTLVVSGGWENAPEDARRIAGAAFAAVCDVIERALRSERLRVPGATHAAQLAGDAFNETLRDFLRRAGS
jgi:pimeloyl-ACP methyl ester carboxylesterase